MPRTMRGYAFLSFQPHCDHRALRASFPLLPLKWSKFNSTAVLSSSVVYAD